MVEKLKIEDHVVFTGWVDSEKIPARIRKADVGLISNHVNKFTNTTIPNKLFDYMAVGLPVLATDMKPVRRVIEREKCGAIIPLHSSYQEMANIILKLKVSPEERAKMGENGRNAVLRRYNWEIEFRKVLSSLEKLRSNKS